MDQQYPTVIEFGDSYKVLASTANATITDTTSGETGKKSRRTVIVTAEDMQKKKNDVKARATLLLSLPDEHQLRFSKYKIARELLAAILKTFGGNEATKKTKKNLLKQQYGNFKAEGSETLEQTFNRLQVIVCQLQFMDVEIERDDLNQNMKKQKKSEPNSQNMAFISLAKHISGNEDGNTTCVPTASTNVPTASASDINKIDEDDMEEMDIKWNMALLSMRVDKFWKKTGKKISIQGSDVAGAPRSQDRGRRDTYRQGSKVEEQAPKALMAIDGVGWDWSYMANDEEDHALVADEEAPTEFALMANTSPKSKDLSWAGLSEFADDTVTDYSRPSPTMESTSGDDQNQNPSIFESEASPSPDFVMKKKACFNCGDFNHLAYDCRKRVKKETSRYQDNTHKSFTPRHVTHRPYRSPVRPVRTNMNGARPNRTTFNKQAHSYANRPFQRTSGVRSRYRAPWVPTVNRNFPPVNRKFSTGSRNFHTANRKFPTASRKFPIGSTKCSTADIGMKGKAGSSQNNINDKCYWDSGCSRHMTGNISYLSDYEPFDGGYVSFGQGGCKITGKGTIKTGKLEFKNVYFVKDLKYNLFSVSRICDNKDNVLFTDSECIVLGRDFKLLDDTNVLLRTPRQHNMYSIDLNNIVPHKDLTCLVAKASAKECMLWHRRLGHLNFKTMNKLVRHNLVKGLPTKCFENNHTYTACLKRKQHKASCKSKLVNSVTKPLHTLHMDLFRPTSDETSGILKKFIIEIENLKDLKVKIIRCDNGREFRNKEMNDFCLQKGIKRKFSNARTPQQNGVAERRNRTLIEAARTMLADAKLLVTFWAEAVNTACYVQNRVLVNKSHNKTSYELFNGTKDATSQEVKKDASFLRNITLPNWAHDALLEYSSSKPQDHCSTEVPEGSGNLNPTASTSNPPADQMETLTVETSIPTVSLPVLTAYSTDSQEPSNESNGVEVDISNMETAITASPTLTLRIDKDHPKSQIIGPVDTPIQTRNKSKEIFDVLQDPSWVEAMHEELLQFKIQNVWTLVDYPKGDPKFPTKVYKVEKAMYGLHQAPRAWYGTLSKYLLINGFQRGTINQNLFIRRQRGDFILVQVYVDDIIFGSSNPQLCREFEALMHEKFQISAMGELNFFKTSM
nr:hypothetical protein [Tanacetum cinerariifolium]